MKYSERAFTLIEILIVVVIIAIISVVGVQAKDYAVDAKKYQESMEKMRAIKRALVGDRRIVTLGARSDFGYYGYNRTWPVPEDTAGDGADEVPVTALDGYLPEMPETAGYKYYKYDAWGNYLVYNTNADTFVDDGSGGGTFYKGIEIKCLGKDGVDNASHTIFDSDMRILIRKNLYEENLVLMNIMDNMGTILRGHKKYREDGVAVPVATQQFAHHQIKRVQILEQKNGTVLLDTAPSGSANDFYYNMGLFSNMLDPGSFSNLTPLECGMYKLRVYATDGTYAGGTDYENGIYDHRDDLLGDLAYIDHWVPVYPKDPENVNFIEFRLPGKVDTRELPIT